MNTETDEKLKIGTQLTAKTLQKAKMVAAEQHVPLSEVIESAIKMYATTWLDRPSNEPGLERFLSSPPHSLNWEDFKEIMEMDYYDQ